MPLRDAHYCLLVRDTTNDGMAAGPSPTSAPQGTAQAGEVDRLRAENARLRDMVQRLAGADVSPELIAAAQVCMSPVCLGNPSLLLAASYDASTDALSARKRQG